MKKISSTILLLFFACTLSLAMASKVLAASLSITKVGTTDVSNLGLGSTLKTYTYTGGTFELAGLASPSATVSVIVDDVTQTATANATGVWTELISSLTMGSHEVALTSNSESLSFTLNIATASSQTATATPTVTVATVSSTSTLAAAGSVGNTFIVFSAAMLLIGLGITIKAKAD